MKDKTKEEILNQKDENGVSKYWRGVYQDSIKLDEKDVLKSMQEYADQQIEAYKAKLKKVIDTKMKTLLSPERYQGMQIVKDFIDITHQ